MDTATTAEPPKHHAKPLPPPKPIDPTKDIDAKATVFWLVVSTVLVFASLWIMYVAFGAVVQSSRASKVEVAPTPALDQLRQYEAKMLEAGPAEGPAETGIPARPKSIEQAIRELIK